MLDLERLYNDADNGVLAALKFLGDIYLEGYEENDIEPDLQKAIEYYEKASEGGMEEALLELGYLYCAGEYMQPDYAKGIEYYKRAADMGNTTALGNLGMSYCKGYGVEKDEKTGFAYFMKAAKGGHPDAMAQVSEMYREGFGVEKDEEKAVYWEKKAEAQRVLDENAKQNENSSMEEVSTEELQTVRSDTLDAEFVKHIFENTSDLRLYTMGECEFKTGRIITADPLYSLQNPEYINLKEKSIAPGKYPVQVSVMDSDIVGLRIVGARLKISENQAVSYEPANCVEDNQKEHRIAFAGFPVECGMGCFCDEQSAQSYWKFLSGWYQEHKDGNIYNDYFAELFAESYRKVPDYQREEGDLLMWNNPLDGSQIAMFATGMGDGIYSDYWGMDASGEICELVIIFMNPELFREENDNEEEVEEIFEDAFIPELQETNGDHYRIIVKDSCIIIDCDTKLDVYDCYYDSNTRQNIVAVHKAKEMNSLSYSVEYIYLDQELNITKVLIENRGVLPEFIKAPDDSVWVRLSATVGREGEIVLPLNNRARIEKEIVKKDIASVQRFYWNGKAYVLESKPIGSKKGCGKLVCYEFDKNNLYKTKKSKKLVFCDYPTAIVQDGHCYIQSMDIDYEKDTIQLYSREIDSKAVVLTEWSSEIISGSDVGFVCMIERTDKEVIYICADMRNKIYALIFGNDGKLKERKLVGELSEVEEIPSIEYVCKNEDGSHLFTYYGSRGNMVIKDLKIIARAYGDGQYIWLNGERLFEEEHLGLVPLYTPNKNYFVVRNRN